MEGFRYYPALGEIEFGNEAIKGGYSEWMQICKCRTGEEALELFYRLSSNAANKPLFANNVSEIINEWINPSPSKISDNLIQGENKKVQ